MCRFGENCHKHNCQFFHPQDGLNEQSQSFVPTTQLNEHSQEFQPNKPPEPKEETDSQKEYARK